MMNDVINRFLTARYRDGGRGENNEYDCWGLTRSARVELYARRLLGSYGGQHRRDPAAFTKYYMEQAQTMREVEHPTPGCVIAVLKRRVVCTHVALVAHDAGNTGLGLHVLEINPGEQARLVPLYRFLESNQMRVVKFYDDKDLP